MHNRRNKIQGDSISFLRDFSQAYLLRALQAVTVNASLDTTAQINHSINLHIWTFNENMDNLELSEVRDINALTALTNARVSDTPRNTLYILEDLSVSTVQALSGILKCPAEVLNDHLRRAGDDVALLLPSQSRAQSHVVIPYRRVYNPSPHREDREMQNTRSSFSHGSLVTTEEHVTIWISSGKESSWTGVYLPFIPAIMQVFYREH